MATRSSIGLGLEIEAGIKGRDGMRAAEPTPPTTPTIMTPLAHQLIDEIRDIHDSLAKLPDLRPGLEANALLTRLVELCTVPRSEELANHVLQIEGVDTLCAALRPLCADAEGELERYWAHHFINSALLTTTDSHCSSSDAQHMDTSPPGSPSPATVRKLLHTFPYFANYLDLSRLECLTVEAFLLCAPDCRPSPSRIAFIGSGPMPLTSICILDRYPNALVHNIDRDAAALRTSERLTEKLGHASSMTFACEDVSAADQTKSATITEWRDFDVVFLAALVGMDTKSKIAILERLARKLEPGTLVVARSAKGLRQMLYPPLELSEDLQRIGLEVLVEVHPWTKVVNSVIVLRVTEH